MNSITVFCASSFGTDDNFTRQTKLLGEALARRNIRLIYGGANVGLMGVLADSVLEAGGEVTGVLTYFLQDREIAHTGLTELIMVNSMHQRKTRMNDLCDGIIALPGGFGTLEELFEILTWGQLGLHKKPVAVLNVNGYYDDLIRLLNNMTDKGLLKDQNRKMLLVSDNIDDLLSQMHNYTPPAVGKWIDKKEV